MELKELVTKNHDQVKENGFWDMELRVLKKMEQLHMDEEEIASVKNAFKAQKMMHAVSEIGEAFEAMRSENNKRTLTELGDSVMVISDMFGGYGWDLESTISAKMLTNKNRPKLHGKRF